MAGAGLGTGLHPGWSRSRLGPRWPGSDRVVSYAQGRFSAQGWARQLRWQRTWQTRQRQQKEQKRVPRLQTYNNMAIFIYIHNAMYIHARPLLCQFSPFLPRSRPWLASDLQKHACAHAKLADTEEDKYSSVSKNEATTRLEKLTLNTPALYLQ